MKNTRVARRYAQALMMTTDSVAKAIDEIATDLEVVRETLLASRELRLFVSSPVVSVEKKQKVFREVFGARIGSTTMSFIDLLTEKQRERALPDGVELGLALESQGVNLRARETRKSFPADIASHFHFLKTLFQLFFSHGQPPCER